MSFMIDRRNLFAGMGAMAMISALSACSNNSGGSGNSGAAKNKSAILVIGTGVAASNQFPNNFNRYGGGDTSPGLDLIYESLFRLSSKNGGQLIPVLAEKVEHTPDGKQATYTLRKGVKWSDGEPFTSKDVKFTLGSVYGPPKAVVKEDEFAWLKKDIETPDDYTVIVTYHSDQRQQEVNLALYYPMVPAHIFQQNNELKFPDTTMSNPVGTGPMKLMKFQSQLVQYEKRDDYWGGEVPVSRIDFVPAGQAGNIETQITQGKVDLAEGGAPGVVKGFATKAPTNSYTFIPDGAARGVIFQMQNTVRPMADVNIRKALRLAIDFEAVRDSAGVGYSLPNMAGVDPVLNKSLQDPSMNEPIKFDAAGAKDALSKAGWKVNGNGNLEKNGKEHPLKIQVQNDNATDMVTVPVIVAQWKENLGINVTFDPKPKDVMDTILQQGDFDMVVSGLNYPGTPWSNYTMYDQPVAKPGEKNTNGNWGRYAWSEATSKSMAILVSTLNTPANQGKIAQGVKGVQKGIVDDAPFIPYQGGGVGMMASSINWEPLKKVEDVDYFPRVGGMENLIKTILDMKAK